jgi:cell division protein FtsB
MARMVVVMIGRSNMASERRDAARVELADIEQLADSLQAEADNLNTAAGLASTLRERYGLVSENEGYLILVREKAPAEEELETQESWWNLW